METKYPAPRILIAGMLFLSTCITCVSAWSQPENQAETKETVFGKKASVRLANQFGITAGSVDKQAGFFISPSLGVLINETIFVGLTGNWLLNNKFIIDKAYIPVKDEDAYWSMNYAGLKLEYSLKPEKAVNMGFGVSAGWGKVKRNFNWNTLTEQSPEWQQLDKKLCRAGYLHYAEPVIFANFNISDEVLMRMIIGYRFTGFRNPGFSVGITAQKFSGPSVGILLQTGNLFIKH